MVTNRKRSVCKLSGAVDTNRINPNGLTAELAESHAYERCFVNVPDLEQNRVRVPVFVLQQSWKKMRTRQERRDSARVPCKLVCPFELTKLVGAPL